MEDFDDPPTSRLQRNLLPVAAATVLAMLGWFFVSNSLAQNDCPRLLEALRSIAHQGTTS